MIMYCAGIPPDCSRTFFINDHPIQLDFRRLESNLLSSPEWPSTAATLGQRLFSLVTASQAGSWGWWETDRGRGPITI